MKEQKLMIVLPILVFFFKNKMIQGFLIKLKTLE